MIATNQTLARATQMTKAFQPGLLLRSHEEINSVLANYKDTRATFSVRPSPASASLFVPVILGAFGPERVGERVAQVVLKSLMQLEHVDTTFVELPKVRTASPYSSLEADETLTTICARAEAMVLILPEYNYGSSPALQDIFKTLLRGRGRKVLGLCDLSPGWLGGLRVMQDLMPVMRQARVLPLLWEASLAHDLNWLDDFGHWREEKHRAPLENFLREVVALAASLRKEKLFEEPRS